MERASHFEGDSLPVENEPKRKRHPGKMIDNEWLVLKESTQDDVGYIHSCGAQIDGIEVRLSVRTGKIPLGGNGEVKLVTVPFCPDCEEEPEGHGALTDGKQVIY